MIKGYVQSLTSGKIFSELEQFQVTSSRVCLWEWVAGKRKLLEMNVSGE